MTYRTATTTDLEQLQQLAILSWSRFEKELTAGNWEKLFSNVSNPDTYIQLLNRSHGIVCVSGEDKIIGMAFLMPSGKAFDVYDAAWCCIRFVTVHPDHCGHGIGKQLTRLCIQKAKAGGEKTIALHTSVFMPNARHIYESLGFSILKEIDQRFGKRYWLYTMEL